MARSIAVIQEKRGRGRPATGHDPVMTVRLPKELTGRIDAHAKSRGETRSEVMRRFLEAGLASEAAAEPSPAPTKPARARKAVKATKAAPAKKTRVRRPYGRGQTSEADAAKTRRPVKRKDDSQ
jgi:negative regulator of replication initiation